MKHLAPLILQSMSRQNYAVPITHGYVARNRLLADMLDAANATIGVNVQEQLPKTMIHPENNGSDRSVLYHWLQQRVVLGLANLSGPRSALEYAQP